MKVPIAALSLSAAVLVFAACKPQSTTVEVVSTPVPDMVAKTKTLETVRLGEAVDAFELNPTAENRANVKKATANLDGEIAELEAYVAKHTGSEQAEAETKWTNLRSYRAGQVARFTAAEAKAPLTTTAPADGRSGADKAEATAEHVGKSIENAAKKTGDAIKDAVKQ